MTVFDDLQRESGVLRHAEFEITGHIGLQRFIEFHHQLAVQQQVRVAYRHGGQFIQCASGEDDG